jgi:hypothetical protein
MASRAERILQNSLKINRQQRLKDDHDKVVKWLRSDTENKSKPRRSSRQHNAPKWYEAYASVSKPLRKIVSVIPSLELQHFINKTSKACKHEEYIRN